MADSNAPTSTQPAPASPGLTSHHAYKYVAIVAGLFALLFGLILCGFAGWIFQNYATKDSGKPKHSVVNSRNRDGQFTFDVQRSECALQRLDTLPDPFVAHEGAEYCLYVIKVKNVGNQPRMLLLGPQKAKDGGGREFTPDMSASEAASPTRNPFPNLMWGGEDTTVAIVFEVPIGTRLAKLKLHDSPWSKGVEVEV